MSTVVFVEMGDPLADQTKTQLQDVYEDQIFCIAQGACAGQIYNELCQLRSKKNTKYKVILFWKLSDGLWDNVSYLRFGWLSKWLTCCTQVTKIGYV
jgi:hypothetical protein